MHNILRSVYFANDAVGCGKLNVFVI